ncbi:MAG TPA: putative PLP-dependent aminotransferase [Azonexus sp.]|nr:putative PLP-dependent aminotransferase [Azonexus sp.]
MNAIFLWPKPEALTLRHFLGQAIRIGDIESRLRDLFPGAEPVLFSSGRAGLNATLEHLSCNRPDLVWCPPFSSHCVFDAISRIATPITQPSPQIRAALIYHHWGYVHSHNFPPTVEIIEDAVDTLFVPGTNPFAVDGRFVLWSLPKTIASQFGGVVFCRDHHDADALRCLRDRRTIPAATMQALLRLLSLRFPSAARYWHGAEASSGPLPDFALRQIAERLEQLPSLAESRRARIGLIAPHSLYPAPDMDRLPSNIPVAPSPNIQALFDTDGYFSAGLRSINVERRAPGGVWIKAAPVAIHAGTGDSILVHIANQLRTEPQTS